MKFSIEGKVYNVSDVERLSLKDLILLQEQTAELGRQVTADDFAQMRETLEGLDKEARKKHPYTLWVLAIAIWASRRRAGEDLSFGDAIEFPITALKWLPEPKDRKPPTVGPTRARPASARATKRAAASGRSRTSKKPSASG